MLIKNFNFCGENMSSVFISYKSDEFDEANWVKNKLEANDISCWMAPMSIHGGLSYAEEIPKAIRECSVFVLILSEKVQESKWVPRELDQAINNNKVILPFMIVNCDLKDEFEFYLSNVQRYEAYKNKEKALIKLIDDIKNVLHTNIDEVVEDSVITEENEVIPLNLPAEKETEKAPARKKDKKLKKNTDKKSKSIGGKKFKKPLIILGSIALAIVVFITAISIYDATNTVWICNEEYKKDDTYLHIEGAQVTNEDILNMAELDQINTIVFKKCHLKGIDLNRILNLVSRSITFDECSISNDDIANLNVENAQISEIVFDNNPQLTDLSVLKTYAKSLNSLSFNNCAISDLSFIKELKKLQYLSADNNNIADISALTGCTEIFELRLSGNKIKSLDAIGEFCDLTILDVSNNDISSLAPLEKLIHLKKFNASSNNLTEISGLSNVTQLETVNLSNNEISDVSVLAKSSLKLSSINIADNKISDISSLAVCNFVDEFIANNNNITNIDALKSWSVLSKIDLSYNQISDVTPLSKCLKLSYVDLSNNIINSVDCLDLAQGQVTGIYLNISNNKLISINLLPFDCSEMIINGNEISDLSFLNGFETIDKLVFDYNEKINYEALKEVYILKYCVLNCPLDKQVYISTTLGVYSTDFTLEEASEL